MATDSTLLGSSGNSTRAEAKAPVNGIATFKFLVSLIVWYDILFEINITSKQLQAKENGISSASKQLECTRMFLEERRSDTEFEKVLVDATELANDLEIDQVFVADSVHPRKTERQFDYEGEDTPVQNAKVNFKVNFYFAVVDVAINSVLERFQQLQQMKSVFWFLV
ncbi:uncharacterized protein [Palaemon carinicauda]|uniref:uncharacterized protein n=1 Tax=Palaemon carinicauda TaxID=392227 RepID=UPI0035B64F91